MLRNSSGLSGEISICLSLEYLIRKRFNDKAGEDKADRVGSTDWISLNNITHLNGPDFISNSSAVTR